MPVDAALAHLALARLGVDADTHRAEGQRLLAQTGACDWWTTVG